MPQDHNCLYEIMTVGSCWLGPHDYVTSQVSNTPFKSANQLPMLFSKDLIVTFAKDVLISLKCEWHGCGMVLNSWSNLQKVRLFIKWCWHNVPRAVAQLQLVQHSIFNVQLRAAIVQVVIFHLWSVVLLNLFFQHLRTHCHRSQPKVTNIYFMCSI